MFKAKEKGEFPRIVGRADNAAGITNDRVIIAVITIQNALQDLKRTERDLAIKFVEQNLAFHDARKLEGDDA
jgi:hypothetical protein